MNDEKEVVIQDEADGFTIQVGDSSWRFDQEDTRERLLDVFDELEIESRYEVVY